MGNPRGFRSRASTSWLAAARARHIRPKLVMSPCIDSRRHEHEGVTSVTELTRPHAVQTAKCVLTRLRVGPFDSLSRRVEGTALVRTLCEVPLGCLKEGRTATNTDGTGCVKSSSMMASGTTSSACQGQCSHWLMDRPLADGSAIDARRRELQVHPPPWCTASMHWPRAMQPLADGAAIDARRRELQVPPAKSNAATG
jgi:hypothetical protein